MSIMKRLNYQVRVRGVHLTESLRVLAGLQPPRPTREERKALTEREREAKAEREAIQWVEREWAAKCAAEAEAARLAEWRDEAGPPLPPEKPTGWYRVERLPGAFFPVGEGPWPDYRPPGLTWDRSWVRPKPDDVPWSDEAPAPKVWAPDPRPLDYDPGLERQGRLF